ncbi:Zinc finger CCCH domain-containing protein 46 [Euphorbia peplus]|nr:Zinc finger CCCH domain-containing protein 46 [Euphorbia peplus]
MPPKKEICRNFQRGSCQYGARCKFLHANSQQHHNPQSSNAFGFGSQSKPSSINQQFKPFENKWTRFSPISTPPSKQSDHPPNHKCTDPNSCKRLIAEDFEQEKPLWKLTCYAHSTNGPCDIGGDVSYEELRAAAYDDAKLGISLQSIVERERNLLNSKLIEFENLLRKPYVAPQQSAQGHSSFLGVTPIGILPTAQTNAPPAVSSFSQLGVSISNRPSAPSVDAFRQSNLFSNASETSNDFGFRPSVPSNNAFLQPNGISNSGQTPSTFVTSSFNPPFKPSVPSNNFLGQPNGIPNSGHTPSAFATNNFNHSSAGFNASSFSSNPSPLAMSTHITNFSVAQPLITANTSNSSPYAVGIATTQIQSVNDMKERTTVSVDPSIWLKESWIAGEIPEEAPPSEYI